MQTHLDLELDRVAEDGVVAPVLDEGLDLVATRRSRSGEDAGVVDVDVASRERALNVTESAEVAGLGVDADAAEEGLDLVGTAGDLLGSIEVAQHGEGLTLDRGPVVTGQGLDLVDSIRTGSETGRLVESERT